MRWLGPASCLRDVAVWPARIFASLKACIADADLCVLNLCVQARQIVVDCSPDDNGSS